jgi:type IV pilus assembly protein PilM
MFFGEKRLVAIDIGTSSIKLAELDMGRKGAVLKRFSIYPIAPGLVNGGEIIDTNSVSEAIASLMSSAKSKRKMAVTGMWGSSVIVKKISMPKMEENLVAEQIKWEAEQYIPFDVNEISLEHHILRNRGAGTESMEVLLVAAKQEFVFRFIETLEIAAVKCAILDVSGFALANCFETNYGTMPGMVALLNIGAGVTNFVVLDNGEVIFCRDIGVGGQSYTSEINKTMGLSLSEAEAMKVSASLGQEVPQDVHNIISSTNEQVIDEIRNSFEFFNATTANGATIQRMFVSGGSIFVPGLVEQVSKAVNVPYEVHDPFQKIGYDPKAFSADAIAQIKAISPVALGLGLRKLTEK